MCVRSTVQRLQASSETPKSVSWTSTSATRTRSPVAFTPESSAVFRWPE